MKWVFAFVLMFPICGLSFAQADEDVESPCSVAGHTESGELAIVCRQFGAGTCYRLSASGVNTTDFRQGMPVWIDFEQSGVRIRRSKGHSVRGLRVNKLIVLNSRQWPWFGPVSEMVCRAGREKNE